MKERALYLLKTYLLTVVIFIIAKPVFMIYNSASYPFTFTDVIDVIYHGLSLDLSTALYFLILPFLLMVVSLFWKKLNIIATILKVYWAIVACLQYLEAPSEAMASVNRLYIAVRVCAFIIVVRWIYKAYMFLVRALRTASPLPTDRKSAAYGLLVALLLVPVFIVGIRGGLDESTTNIGQVYYSQTPFLNHSAVNPVFSFLSSFEETASYIPDYHFMDEQERASLMKGLYSTKSIDPDTLLCNQRPNIIVILMESCGGIFTEDIGGRKDIMPNLNKLTKEGVYFANFYANSYRTDRGTLCAWSGYPSFPRSSVMKMPAKVRFLPGIAKSLLQEGYKTSYLYGGDINFTNKLSGDDRFRAFPLVEGLFAGGAEVGRVGCS